ncbi:AREL1 [Cordylochernes scorpioides]|uniref:AREL1 n=1 Tax=Cordylochernes scorpioides TaxID=51811 RepID=A0ABY6LTA8_9ARAC|nr:AREL1 [Cordylochernes scorpioides]
MYKCEIVEYGRVFPPNLVSQHSCLSPGGSETFKDKQYFFYHEVRKLHSKYFHDKLPIRVTRDKLLDSVCTPSHGHILS